VSAAIVASAGEAAGLPHGAAIVLEPLREFLDAAGLGSGELEVTEIGDGHSNLSFLVRRGESRFVLRRPPLGELAPSANNVLRESRVLAALATTTIPVPELLASCEDEGVVGAPFFVMSFVDGVTVNDRIPADLDLPGAPERIADDVIGALTDLHAAELEGTPLGEFGRPSGYLERQLRQFRSLLESNATRPLPDLDVVADWLEANRPGSPETTFVHGDYRLGNLMFARPLRLAAVLDWEMATVGDPLADLGYCTVMWAEADDPDNPMFALSRATTQPGFPTRADLVRRYADATGRSLDSLPWYQVLALWKSAIFLEGSYQRFVAGASEDPFFADLDHGVPALAGVARDWISRAG